VLKNIKLLLIDKLGIGIIWNVGSLAILALGGIIINLVILKLRGAGALGIFNQVYAIYIVLSQIGVGGVQYSVLQQISYNQNDLGKCANITSSALLIVALITIIMGAVGWLIAQPIGILMDSPGVGYGLQLVMPGLLFFSLNKVLINVINGLAHMRAYAVFRSVRFILIPLLIFVIIGIKLPNPYIVLSLTIPEILLFIGLCVYINSRMFTLWGTSERWTWLKKHISFGVRGAGSGIFIEFSTRVDVLMLGIFTPDEIVGIYSFVSTLAEGFAQIPLAVRWNIDPLIGQYFSKQEINKIEELAKKIRRQFFPLMGAACLVAIFGYPLFYNLWVGDNTMMTSWFTFAIIMVGVIINGGYRPFTGILLQGGKPGTYTLFYVFLVLGAALLNLVFITTYGIYGAAAVTSFTYFMEALILVILSRKLFGVRL
jgi:O-antigen/teichoic acid export membrane protein